MNEIQTASGHGGEAARTPAGRRGIARVLPGRLAAVPSGRLLGFGVLALVLLLGLSACGLGGDERPYTHIDPATEQASDIQGLYKTLFYMAAVVFILVQFLIVYTALRYRRRRRSVTRPAQVHGNSRLEITWTVIPAVVLLIILVPTISILYSMDAEAEDEENAMIVEVYGKQWWWELHYPGMGADESQPLVTANEVRVPVDQKIIFKLQSNNVIHSFWVPQLSGKMDVMPGYENKLTFTTPSEPGEYFGECAEFCGVDHAWMRFKVIVMPRAEFDTWVAAWNAPAAYDANPATAGISEAPQALGLCLLCHNVNGAVTATGSSTYISGQGYESTYTNGPNLTLFGCREGFAGGLMTTNEENLREWLYNPLGVKEANLMGTAIKEGTLNEQQITDLTAYLLALRLPDGTCPSDLANTDAIGGQPAAAGQVPEGVATPAPAAATPAATPAAGDATPGVGTPAVPVEGAAPPPAEGEAPPPAEGEAPPAGEAVELSAPGIAWSVYEITIAQGGTINLFNDGSGGAHNFVIEGYNDDEPVDMPIGETVPWVVPEDLAPGTYVYYCAIPGHRALMEGSITIT